ncbi:unnamed protein product [Choristocarpus tenellus]
MNRRAPYVTTPHSVQTPNKVSEILLFPSTTLSLLRLLSGDIGSDHDDLSSFLVQMLCLVKGVSHFFPGAFQNLPETRPSTSVENLLMCGDWINRGGHRSWSQEKALVEGRAAAAEVCRLLGVREGYYPSILPVERDEPHVAAGRSAVRLLRSVMQPSGTSPSGPQSPGARVRQEGSIQLKKIAPTNKHVNLKNYKKYPKTVWNHKRWGGAQRA